MAPYLGSIEYMRTKDWDEFLTAMNHWGTPGENLVYADTEGNIGWKPAGFTPIRSNWDGLLPVPGDGRYARLVLGRRLAMRTAVIPPPALL